MVTVRDVEKFARKNEPDLKKFMVYKTHIIDRDLINDSIQEFYIRLIESKALDTFDESEGTFDTYIMKLFCWTLPVLKKKKMIRGKNMISVVFSDPASGRGEEEKDVWECLQMHPYYKVDPTVQIPLMEEQEESDVEQELDDFISYIKETEKPKKAERMITFIERRQDGCKAADIAVMLELTDNHIKCIKQEIEEKFKKWQKRNLWF